MDDKEIAEMLDNIEFLEFVSYEAERMLVHATGEDLAIFAFGSVEEAIEAFQETQAGNEDV